MTSSQCHRGAITLVLGGARSGKSRHAETLSKATGLARFYLATAQAFDDEMRDRIITHRNDRKADGWTTIEVPIGLPKAIAHAARPDRVVMIDCLTLWLSNVMLAGEDVPSMQDALLSVLAAAAGPVILVSNEVGLGLVPETPLGRAFRDAQGRLNQSLAALADDVIFVAAGLPLAFKSRMRPAPPLPQILEIAPGKEPS